MNTFIKFRNLTFAVLLLCVSASTTVAQESDEVKEALGKAHKKFQAVLDDVNGLFYKRMENDNGAIYYVVVWEAAGETSKINFELKHLGQYQGTQLFGLLAYTTVAQSEGSMPPAVIKAVANKNESTLIGAFSMTDAFDTVYLNFSTPSDTMTAGQIWVTCAVMHNNRVQMKQMINELLAESR